MAGCNPMEINNIDLIAWEILVGKVKSLYGIDVSGFKGSGNKYGYSLTWDYDAPNNILTVQCTQKPEHISCETVTRDITNFINNNR